MLGLIALATIGIYVLLFFLLPLAGRSPRQKLLIKLVVLSPVIWVVGNGLVGYAWFRVSCEREAKLVVLENNLPPARVLRLEGWLSGDSAAENLLSKFTSLEAVEAQASKYSIVSKPRPAYSRYERGPLRSDSWAGRREYERRESPLDIVEVRPGGVWIAEEGKSQAQYLLVSEKAKRGFRQYVNDIRLLRPDGTLLARDVSLLYLWMDSSLVPFGAASQDSSRCGADVSESEARLVRLVAN
jgi:hypothetical protein